MKTFGLALMAAAFVCSSGFLKKSEDGSYAVDTSGIEKKADEVAAAASAKAEEMTGQAENLSAKAIEKIKEQAAKLGVSKEEVLADLQKPLEEIKTKVAAMDPAKLTAYLGQYASVFADAQTNVTEYTQQVKDLNWIQKFTTKGKELKTQLEQYTTQFNGLKEQAGVYLEKLKGYGLDPAALGIDLSAYGL
ncbi:hypothetical protein [Pontiella agarivorans]|uniref:Lipoprotein n=1 Tax=Pontiella agarivorans TaxID=3038953 RepID=A0ABU5MW62_9BACT|nr:hypothetical protein [Pontiella agarivorans]MDZ8118363.1 hypothetical protein [Pontiella agarivorans]